MKNIDAEKFQEQCLYLLENLEDGGVVITKEGKPIARLTPYERTHAHLIGSLKGKIKVKGDIFSTGAWDDWDAKS